MSNVKGVGTSAIASRGASEPRDQAGGAGDKLTSLHQWPPQPAFRQFEF